MRLPHLPLEHLPGCPQHEGRIESYPGAAGVHTTRCADCGAHAVSRRLRAVDVDAAPPLPIDGTGGAGDAALSRLRAAYAARDSSG